ncbi:sigma factor-like helix-turn-helix DNA-binding protein [Georgenia yuyongxinii]|uniref:sigma factor-like helix-turn-helix DNA-binding protein n=1 Tax=Georgenia yuyongxinii TaxID=2589797 RepID=UPI00163D73F1
MRRAVALRAEGRTIPEIATELGIGVSTVKRRLAAAATGEAEPVRNVTEEALVS